jgi:PAS domain S-box-containing protein
MNRPKTVRHSISVRLWWLFGIGMIVAAIATAALWLIRDATVMSDTSRLLAALVLLVAAVSAVVLAGVFIRARILAPLEALRKGAAAFTAGDLVYRVEVDTGDELEHLAREYNQMAATLRESQQRLASLAREREREAEDAQARLREMTALIQSGRAITSLDLQDVLGRLAYEVARAVQGDRCSIYVLDAKQRRLVLRAEWDGQPSAARVAKRNGQEMADPVTFEWGEGIVGWVAREGKSLFLANAQADKRFVAKSPNDSDIAAVIGVPLVLDNSVVGVLQASTRPGTPAFDPSDQRLLATFASQAVAAIQNSFLYESERRRARELTIIAEISRTLSSSLDLDATLDSILVSVQQLISYDLAEITLWDAGSNVLRTHGRGADPAYAEYSRTAGGVYRLDEGITGRIASRRAPVLVADVQADALRPAIDLDRFPVRSVAGVPMIAGRELVGTLELASFTVGAFNEGHLETLRTIGAQAAVAIQNARLYLDSRRRAEEAAGLFRVASIAASAQEPNEILRQIMAEASRLMGADLGIVLLFNPETEHLEAHPTALFGASYETVRDFRIDTRKPTFHHSVFRSGRVFRAEDALVDRRLILKDYHPFLDRFAARRVLSAPLMVRDLPIGEIHIVRKAGAPFSEDDAQRLLTLASLLGGVVETARLAIERAERLDELTGLYEISQAIASLTDLQQVYHQITRSIAERLGVEFAGLLLYDTGREMLVSQPPFYGVPDEVLEHYLIPLPRDSAAYRLWLENDTWISNDVPNDPLTQAAGLDELARAVGVHRTLLAAMTVGARRIGVIQVSNKRDGQPFDAHDARVMSIFATQIATVVENARLYALTDVRLQQRVDELTALSGVSQELSATLELDRILELVLNEAARAAGAARGTIMLVAPGTPQLMLRALLGFSPEEAERARMLSLHIGDGIVGKVIETGLPLLVDDVRASPDYVQLSAETQSELCVPIRYALEVVGAINLESSQPARFNRDHITFLQALAAQAAIAIGNHQRYEEQLRRGELLRRRAEQLANLFEIGQAFRSDRPLGDVLEDVVHAVQETAGFNVAMLSLLVDDPPVLERVAAAGLPLTVFEDMKRVRQPWDAVRGIMHDAFRISQSYYIPAEHNALTSQVDTWPPFQVEFAPRASGRWHEQDVLFTLLRGSGDRVVGLLSVDQPLDGRVPDRAAVETLELFANQAAIAIENARLLEDLQHRIDSLTLFNQVSRTISSRLDREGLFGTIVDAAVELTGSRGATIFLREEATGTFVPHKAHGWEISAIGHLTWKEGEGLVGTVAREGRPLIVADAKTDALFQRDPSDELIGSMLLVPFVLGSRVIGVLCADKPRARAFSNTDLMLLSTLADQAAIAIENAQLFEQTMARTRELSTLFEATTAITSDLALDRVVNAVAGQLLRALNVQTVTITRWDRAHGQAVVMVDRDAEQRSHLDPPGTSYELATYPGASQMLEDLRARVLRHNDPDLEELDRINLQRLGLKAQLRMPLVVQDRIIGMVELGERYRERAFTFGDIQLAQTLTSQAAVALTNAELFAETQRRVAELQSINAISQAITATMPLAELVDVIRHELGRVIDTSSFYIALYHPLSNQIVFPTFYDRGVLISPDPIPPTSGVTGFIFTQRRPLLINTPADLEVMKIEAYGDVSQSYIGVPLLIGDVATGVMAVQDYQRPYAYDEGHLRILTTIAAQSAVAIENARLFEETQRRLREQGLLYEAGRAISTSLEYNAVLETAADQLLRITGWQGVIFSDWDHDRDQLTIVYSRYADLSGVDDPDASGRTYTLAEHPHIRKALHDRDTLALRSDDPALTPHERADLQRVGFRTVLMVPMIARDQVIGSVWLVESRHDRLFSESDLHLIATLANQIASVLTNARLFDEVRNFTQVLEERVRQRTDELAMANAELTLERDRVETLYRITSELSASLDLDRVLNRALALVNDAVGSRRSSIVLVDNETSMLVHRAALGLSQPLPPGGRPTRFKRNQGLAGWVIQNRLPAIVPDIHHDDRWLEESEHATRQYHSALAVPLAVGDDALGALLLLHEEADYFAEAHLRLVEAAATQVATAINNAALYGFIRESAERLGTMLRDQQIEAAKAQAILESVADGVMVVDAADSIILFNAAAERMLGRARESMFNRSATDVSGLYGPMATHWEKQVERWRNESQSRRDTPALSHNIHIEDEKRFVKVSIAPVTLGEEFLGTVSVFRDITAEVEADRAKSEFVSTVSHELRTPMTSIKGYADLLLMGAAGALNENQDRFLNIIKSNADRLSVLVNDLLDISRIETGRVVLDRKHVSMVVVVEQVIASLRERIEQKQLTLHTEFPPDDSLLVLGDHARLTQILTNLVSNAQQYTLPGGTITVRAQPGDDGMLLVEVNDTGIGIAAEDQPKVFDRFFRADDPVVQAFSGTGLGLSIVKSLIEMHGGQIGLSSEVGKGTTFAFTVPLADVEPLPALDGEPARSKGPVRSRGAAQRVPRILVIEDEPDIASLIEHNLAQVGYTVKTVGTGKAAIDLIRRERPDLVTLDLYLPDIDGQEVLDAIKADPTTADVPVIVVSVMPESGEVRERGALEYITKPLDTGTLVDAVSRVLGTIGTVLVVEDDLDTCSFLTESLQRSGFRVLVTANGRQGLELAKAEQPDLVLLDLKLPRMDGYTVLKHLKKSPKTARIPVIIMTGSVTLDEIKRQEFIAMGAANFLPKPFNVNVLIGQIEAVLMQAQEAQAAGQ